MEDDQFVVWKVSSAAILLLLTYVCSYLPFLIQKHFKKSKLAFSYLNCLAGGIVLGALLMHLIPELSHSHSHSHGDKKTSCGHSHSHGGKKTSCGHSHAASHLASAVDALSSSSDITDVIVSSAAKGHKHDHKHGSFSFNFGHFMAGCSFLLLLAVDRLFMHSHSHSHDHGHEHATNQTEKSIALKDMERMAAACMDEDCHGKLHAVAPEADDCASCHSEDLVGGCHMDGLDAHSSRSQAFVFVIALSLHSFLEGLGAATQNSKENLVMYLISLFGHKWLEAFALGVNVLNAKFSRLYRFLLISFYACLTPLGIILGMIFEKVTLNGPYANITSQCLNGAAVGSFIFVCCIEMIPPEFHKKTSHTIWKFITLCCGFAVMSALSIFHFH